MRSCELSEKDRELVERLQEQRIKEETAKTRKELHNALMNMALEAVESGNVQIESVEDLETVFFLGLLLEIS